MSFSSGISSREASRLVGKMKFQLQRETELSLEICKNSDVLVIIEGIGVLRVLKKNLRMKKRNIE